MKAPLPLFALAACLFCAVSCRSSRPAEETAPTDARVSVSPQNAPLPLKTQVDPGAPSASLSRQGAVSDSPFVPKNPGLRISRVNVPDRLVALTFDDGPHGSLTPRILDILNRHGAKGTFFVLGSNAKRFPGILQRAAAEGHEIGSHTWSHVKMTSCGREKLLSEMNRTRDAIVSATGRAPAVMRPPYGAINASTLQTIYSAYGTPAILWDVDTNDWRKPGVQTVISRAVNNARSGSIILVHDIHASTADAVEGIVTGLQARGFRLVTVSELIAAGRRASGGSAPARSALPQAVIDPAPPAVRTVPSSSEPAKAGETNEFSATVETPGASSVEEQHPAEVTGTELPPVLPSSNAGVEPPAGDGPAPRNPALPALRLRTPALSPAPAGMDEDADVLPAVPTL